MKTKFNEIIRTKYLERIRPFYESKFIKVITGVRRCGKSTILSQIKNDLIQAKIPFEQIIEIDLEKDPYARIKTVNKLLDLVKKKIINKNKYYIFIDEIQKINKFEIAIAAIRATYNCSLFVTGSNSKLLNGKLKDRLTGRAKEFEILPFMFNEYIEFKKINNLPISHEIYEINNFLKWGGLPQLNEQQTDDDKISYLFDLRKSIIEKDIFQQHKRLDKDLFNKISNYIIATSGKMFSALSIAKFLKNELEIENPKKFSKTIFSYGNHLVESYILKECYPLETGTKRSLLGTRKFYNIDNGIRFSIGDPNEFDISFALENAVYLELLYQGYKVFYGRHNQYEIDFIAIKDNKQYLIQVTRFLNDEVNIKRELKPFKYFKNNDRKYILSFDPLESVFDGVKCINVIDFLLHRKSLE